MYTKMRQLEDWDKSIMWSLKTTQSNHKHQLAELLEGRLNQIEKINLEKEAILN
jgi:hypothetical protein